MTDPVLIMSVSVLGSSKTTFARQLSTKLDAVVINSDAIRLSMLGSRQAILETNATQLQRDAPNALTFGALNYAARTNH